MRNSYSPDSSVNQAIDFPSGDHAGQRSFAVADWVMLRSSPFSIGTVTISPRYSNAARAPDGDRLACRTYFAPFAHLGLASTRSAETPIFNRASFRVAGSKSERYPPRSKMILPAPALAFMTGQSV